MVNNHEAILLAETLIKRFEGCRLRPYLCPAGIPTIGFGSTFYPNGVRVTLHDPAITLQEALRILRWQIEHIFLPEVLRLCPHIDTAPRLAAIIDFTFNLGASALKTSTLRKRINADRWEDVPRELMKWVKGGGKTLSGLVKRRNAEAALI